MTFDLYPVEEQCEPALVCVTGGTGFVAGPIIARLLAAGHTVRTTVRDPTNQDKLKALKALDGAEERLTFFAADLEQKGSFAEAIQGCKYVMHTASPFFTPKTQADVVPKLLNPAVNGTENVLETVTSCPSVQRVVLTSSVAAVAGDSEMNGKGVKFTEADWSEDTAPDNLPYYHSKFLAERKAWEIQKAQSRWELVTINPGFVMGPPLGDREDGSSVGFIKEMLNGKLAMAPPLGFGVVPVQDVATAHCLAMVHPDAKGRYICVEGSYTASDLGDWCKEKYPNQKYPGTGWAPPTWAVKLLAPLLGLRRDFVAASVRKVPLFDNSKIQSELGMRFTPSRTAVQDMADKLVALGQVTPNQA